MLPILAILFRSFRFIVIKHFKIIWLSILSILSVLDEMKFIPETRRAHLMKWRLFQERAVRTKFDIYVCITCFIFIVIV